MGHIFFDGNSCREEASSCKSAVCEEIPVVAVVGSETIFNRNNHDKHRRKPGYIMEKHSVK